MFGQALSLQEAISEMEPQVKLIEAEESLGGGIIHFLSND